VTPSRASVGSIAATLPGANLTLVTISYNLTPRGGNLDVGA
jgi:hypothetical protein